MSDQKPLRIPYGVADYVKLRAFGEYYQDKTRYLPTLEAAGHFLFLIRPRRFGKSLLQSMMECYYDCHRAEAFDDLFGGTWIHANPTPEHHGYMVLRFDFSRVHGSTEALSSSFDRYCRIRLRAFMRRYADDLPPSIVDLVLAEPTINSAINALLTEMELYQTRPMYLFIDEYDNFANTVLASEGREAYRALTHGRGFLRDFFAELKGAAGASGGALARLFITGVSPVTLDDVTSGFNIARNISIDGRFNGLLGFNTQELTDLFAAFGQDYSAHQDVMQQWYDHYRFAQGADGTVTNSDMALYYLSYLVDEQRPPPELIDANIRIDYGKLRHLVQLDRKLNGSWQRLNRIIADGHIASPLVTSFPAEMLDQSQNFISLLHYFGLLTLSEQHLEGVPVLVVPNQTVWQLMYGYIRDALDDVGLFRADIFTIGEKLRALAWHGEWEPFFDHLAAQIAAQAGMRDYLNGEKMVQGFLLAWLNLNPWFLVLSEQELGGGFVDLYLSPCHTLYPQLNHAWLIELKYLSREKDSPAARQQLIADAKAQLLRYSEDQRVLARAGHATRHRLVLLFVGWELVHREAV